MRNLIVIGSCCLALASPGWAASFDCNVAKTRAEKWICSNPELSQLDEELAASYAASLKKGQSPEAIKNDQRHWIRAVRDQCQDSACVRSAYRHRLAQLSRHGSETIAKSSGMEQSAGRTRAEDVCENVVRLANAGKTAKVAVKSRLIDEAEASALLPAENGNIEFYALIRLWDADLDGDGNADLMVETDAQLVAPRTYVRSRKPGSAINVLEGEGEMEFWLLKVGGRYYLIGEGWKGSLTRLWEFDASLEFRELCRFRQSPVPAVSLIAGKGIPVCDAAAKHVGRYVEFSEEHHVEALPGNGSDRRFWAKSIEPGLAVVDIDNDGKLDNVIRLGFFPGNGRQCDSEFLALADQQRTAILNNRVTGALSKMSTCIPSANEIQIFSHEGVNYIDAIGWKGDRDIYRIFGGELQKVCAFQGQVINEVVR